MKITVNGADHDVTIPVSYEEIAALAGYPGATQLSMTYHGRVVIDGEHYEKNGSLIAGESVNPVDGMGFTACYTGNA